MPHLNDVARHRTQRGAAGPAAERRLVAAAAAGAQAPGAARGGAQREQREQRERGSGDALRVFFGFILPQIR